METKKCIVCGKEFPRGNRSSIKWEKAKFCSIVCKGKSMEGKPSWNKDIHWNEETRKKISSNHADVNGENNPNFGRKGELSPLFGKKQPIEWNIKKSKTLKERGIKPPTGFGSENSNWKGGITPLKKLIRDSSKYSDWRTQVFGRDNFTCQECGARGTYFEAHHKKRFTDILTEYNITTLEQALECNDLWDISNGITLCSDCHEKIPKNTKGD